MHLSFMKISVTQNYQITLALLSVLLTGLGADSPNLIPLCAFRLIKVDYSFESESVLYDVVDNKVKTPSTYVAGNFTFESLHHDIEGGMLGRYRLTVCKTGNCGNVPDVYVSFVQGGNNIQEKGIKRAFSDSRSQWNFIYAIINTIYTPAENGEGDDQNVDTVYGKCQVQFGRPEDKRFRRKINNCKVKGDVNFTRIDGIQPVHYEQDVSYLQNTKIDADIVVIDAIELLRFGAPLHNKWGFTLESRTHVEITNRTMNYVARHCNSQTQTAAVCASEKFGAVSVGRKLYEHHPTGSGSFQLADLVAKYRSHLYDMGDSHTCEEHSKMFAEIVQEGRLASEQDWKAVLMHPENEHVLGNVLGALGNSQSLKIAREVLLVEGPDFLDDYLFGAAHTTSNDEKWHKQLMYWLKSVKEEDETYWKVANTLATVLRKRCDRTPSTRNSCHLGKERVDPTHTGHSDSTSEHPDIVAHVGLQFGSFEIARGFLCTPTHSAPVQMAALQLIKAASPTLYDSKLANVLIKLFRNVCPQPTSTGESQLAVDILVRCLPEQQHVATMLLRTETLNPDDHEKWQYFYKAVESSGHRDELKDEVWRQMRKFKVFRPNYAHRALKADSHAHWHEITDIDGYRLHSTSEVEFDSGVFRRSEFDIGLKHGKVDENTTTELPLLSGLTVDVSASGALSIKVLTSASISILSQETQADLRTNISMSLISRATLLHHGEPVHKLNSDVSVLTTVGSEADVRFSEIPFGFCITISNLNFSFNSVSEAPKKPRKKMTVTATKTYPGVTYKLDDNITKQCSLLFRKDMEQA
ncbi:unnamed protein product [Haemonchus placei]|uniref:Vitellogenin domain-containing protein n=1 Tax=Haemonchus placei TaxID=6290 RepID=A0A158QM94_HAEPC|nr:unnamed protein product [Haemonchus placei]